MDLRLIHGKGNFYKIWWQNRIIGQINLDQNNFIRWKNYTKKERISSILKGEVLLLILDIYLNKVTINKNDNTPVFISLPQNKYLTSLYQRSGFLFVEKKNKYTIWGINSYHRLRDYPDTDVSLLPFPYQHFSLPLSESEMAQNLSERKNKIENGNTLVRVFPDDYYNSDGLSNYFTEYARIRARNINRQSPWNEWNDRKTQFWLRRTVKNGDPFRYSEKLYQRSRTVNIFNPAFGLFLLDKYIKKGSLVLDPFAGWGDRLISTYLSDAGGYHGWDNNPLLRSGYDSLVDYFQMERFKYHVTIGDFLQANIKNNKYNLVITSPPFFTLEIYKEIIKSTYKEWLENFIAPVIDKCVTGLKVSGKMIWYVSDYTQRDGKNKKVIALAGDISSIVESRGDMKFVEVLYFRSDLREGQNIKTGLPRPAWVWQKIREKKVSKVVQTVRLFLRQYQLTDLDSFSKMQRNPENMNGVGAGKVKTRTQSKKQLLRYIQEYKKETYVQAYPIVKRRTEKGNLGVGTIIGFISVYIGSFDHPDLQGHNFIRILINKKYRNQGYASEILPAFIKHFSGRNILAMVSIDNTNSNKLFKKYLLTKNITFREKDYYLYSLNPEIKASSKIKSFFSTKIRLIEAPPFNQVLSENHRFEEVKEWEQGDLIWKITGKGLNIKNLPKLVSINSFPGDLNITDKAKLIESGKKIFGNEWWDIHPLTLFPKQFSLDKVDENTLWVVKPTNLSKGQGIELMKSTEIKKRDNVVIQKYLTDPYLLDGYKFDLRLIVAKSENKFYLYTDFPVRVSDKKFDLASEDLDVHLTNISRSGRSEHTDRRFNSIEILQPFKNNLIEFGKKIKKLFVEEVLGQWPDNINSYNVYAIDVILDKSGKVWLLEINVNPGGNDKLLRVLTEQLFRMAQFEEVDKREWIKL